VPSLLRVLNDRSTLELLLTDGAITRAELGRRTGLSRVTASQSLARLEALGLVEVVGSRSAGRGPNADVYAVCQSVGRVVGIDLRASAVGVSIATVTGDTLATATRPSEVTSSLDGVVSAVDSALAEASVARDEVSTVVVGVPGVVNPETDDIAFSFDLADAAGGLRRDLSEALGVAVTLENDVNLAAVAESRVGAAVGHRDFALVWVGEGVGLAVMVDGRLHRGSSGAAGEIGYLPVPGVDLPEQVDHVSQGAYQRLVGSEALASLAQEYGLHSDAPDAPGVVAAALRGEGQAHGAFVDEVAARIALGVGAVAAVIDPGLVVLTGDTGRAGGPALAAAVAEHVARIAPVRPQVAASAVGESAVLTGATLRAVRTARRELLAGLDGAADE
jgi:predicted NBD/HSP70 family sugar kinase